MRNQRERKVLGNARSKSARAHVSKVIFNTPYKREFFRYVDGELREYDLSKYNGKEFRLDRVEMSVINSYREKRK
jgi:hypothetical protein